MSVKRGLMPARAAGASATLPAVHEVPMPQPLLNGRSRLLRRNDYLWHAGDPVDGLYRVRSGMLKRVMLLAEGQEQVLGFYSASDIVGYEVLDRGCAPTSLIALDTTYLEAIPCEVDWAGHLDAGTRAAFAAMQADIQRLSLLVQMERTPSCQRLAAFLWRQTEGGTTGIRGSEIQLPMNRRDLAAYLGVAPETLCRAFSRLRRLGIIECNRGRVYIADPTHLERAALQQPAARETGMAAAATGAG